MLSIKHLNSDASFLLTFEPLLDDSSSSEAPAARPYHVLLDPWIVGSSKIFHSKISLTRHTEPACVSSLRQLPEPDLVIISQSKSDHCNEATLKQLPPSSKAVILAEPAAARVIQSWKHFDRRKVLTLNKWEDHGQQPKGKRAPGGGGGSKHGSRHAVTRIPLPPAVPGGEPGEVTVAFIPQKRDLTGLHAAIGITFRSAPRKEKSTTTTARRTTNSKTSSMMTIGGYPTPCVTFPLTPPATPKSHRSYPNLPILYTNAAAGGSGRSPHALYPPPPPPPSLRLLADGREVANHHHHSPTEETCISQLPPLLPPLFIPRSPTPTIRSARSCSTLTPTNTISSTLSAAATLTNTTPTTTTASPTSILSPHPPPPKNNNNNMLPIATTNQRRRSRTLSVLFSPHGIPYQGNLESYTTTHLINEAALPLTALLHCFDSVRNPWWLGGNVVLGAPAGRDIAVKLHARCWLSCHDGEKDVKGLATGWVKTRRWDRDVLERAVTGQGRDVEDVFSSTAAGGGGGDWNNSSSGGGGSGSKWENNRTTTKKMMDRGHQPVMTAGEKKLELRRVGSKLRLWPSPSSKEDAWMTSGITTITTNNKNKNNNVEQEQEPERREAPPVIRAVDSSIISPTITTTAAATAATTPLTTTTISVAKTPTKANIQGTQIIDLASGEMVVLTSDGPWNVFRGQDIPM